MPRKILIIDDHDDLATALTEAFCEQGHKVTVARDRDLAMQLAENNAFEVVITDLDGEKLVPVVASGNKRVEACLPVVNEARSNLKAFKICLAKFNNDGNDDAEMLDIVKLTLQFKARFIDRGPAMQNRVERIEFEVPSTIELMHDILDYLMSRVEKLGVVKPEKSNLFVALDEAFVNAVKHGNKFDISKLVKIVVDISREKASFTIEDEGEGFDVNSIPDPTVPDNLFKSSGRGVMFIYNIMDEVTYNERGNRLTMVKRTDQKS